MVEIIFRYQLMQRLWANMKCIFPSRLPTLPAPICKEGSGKTKQINFIKTNTQHPLSKERGTIQLKLFAANFRFYKRVVGFLEILNI